MNDTQFYAVPQHYAARTPGQLDRLRKDLGEAQAAAAATKDGAQRQQAESTAKGIERELHAAETTARDEQRAANAAPDSFDRRYGYAANFRGEQEFMPITPYFAKPEKPKLTRTVNVKGPACGPANAIAVNGIVRAVTTPYFDRGRWTFSATLPPESLHQGRNRVEVLAVIHVSGETRLAP